jgi:hypothetical protein
LNVQIRGLRLLLMSVLTAAPIAGQEARDTLEVFFVGNSYICFNNLPGLLEGISQELDGPYVSTASHTHGGYTLRKHLTDGHLPGAFETDRSSDRAWDIVVLQEQSALATVTDTVTGETTRPSYKTWPGRSSAKEMRGDLRHRRRARVEIKSSPADTALRISRTDPYSSCSAPSPKELATLAPNLRPGPRKHVRTDREN